MEDAKQAAAYQAEKLGLEVIIHPEFMEGDAEEKATKKIKKEPRDDTARE